MPRPTHIKDLPAEKREVEIMSINFEKLAIRPSLATKVTGFIAELERFGATLRTDYSGLKVLVPASAVEMEIELSALQSNWDYRSKQYDAACAADSIDAVDKYMLNTANSFAEKEKRTPVADVIAARAAAENKPQTIVERGALKPELRAVTDIPQA